MQQVVDAAPRPGAPATPNGRWDLRRAIDHGLFRLFQARSNTAYRLGFLALAVGTLTASAALFFSGCSPIFERPGDSILPLDGAWRVFRGQRPHTDFYSAIGIIPYLITDLGMLIAGPSADALVVGPATLLPLIAWWSWSIARRRVSAMHALALASFIGFLTVGQFAAGDEFRDCSYAMQYNRLAWSFLCLLLLEAFISPLSTPTPRVWFWEGISSGALLGLLAFTKFTYFGAAGVALVCALAKRGRQFQRLCGILVGFLVVLFLSAAFLRFDLRSYVADILMLSRGHHVGEELALINARSFATALWWLFLLAFTILVWQPGPFDRFRAERYYGLLGAAFIFSLGLVILATNAPADRVPALVIAAWVLFEPAHHAQLGSPERDRIGRDPTNRFVTGSVLMMFAIAPFLCADVGSIAYGTLWKQIKGPRAIPAAHFQSAALAPMIVPGHMSNSGRRIPNPYVPAVNDGLKLLHAHVNESAKVLCLAFANPFSFADLRPCPHGGASCWHYPRLVNERSYPRPEAVFIDADAVMVPRNPEDGDSRFLLQCYGEALRAQYDLRAQSEYWDLYLAKPGRVPAQMLRAVGGGR